MHHTYCYLSRFLLEVSRFRWWKFPSAHNQTSAEQLSWRWRRLQGWIQVSEYVQTFHQSRTESWSLVHHGTESLSGSERGEIIHHQINKTSDCEKLVMLPSNCASLTELQSSIWADSLWCSSCSEPFLTQLAPCWFWWHDVVHWALTQWCWL